MILHGAGVLFSPFVLDISWFDRGTVLHSDGFSFHASEDVID